MGRATTASIALSDAKKVLDQAVAAVPNVPPGGPEPDLTAVRNALRVASRFGIVGAYPALLETTLADLKALVAARIAALPPAATQAQLLPLRDALARAQRLGIAVEPASVVDPTSTADQQSTVAAATNALASNDAAIAAAGVRVREALLATAASVSAEMKRRIAAAAAAADAPTTAQAVFGRGFVLIVRFRPGDAAELQAALDYGPTLAPDANAKATWLAQAERVRKPLARWRRLELYANCLGTAPPLLAVAQLPHVEPARWVALDFPNEADRPLGGRVSLALISAVIPPAAGAWSGMLIDEWTEKIPAVNEATGIAFHYDDPSAEAAQTVLLAVPPTGAKTWDMPTLLAILDETLTLAKVRAVQGDLPGDLGQLLPAAFLAANPANDTITTDLRNARAVPARMLFQG
jgi:hypothetical protein